MILACLALAKFVLIPAGTYPVGSSNKVVNLSRKVKLKAFEIATTETTNREFAEFVRATGYRTDAERFHNGMVFEPGLKEFQWIRDESANWQHPNGSSRDSIKDRADHPVTCISFYDALAYCRWAKVRLPSLEEWEVACRAGTKTDYFFGTKPTAIARYANVWHGRDHLKPDTTDGFMVTAPVASFKPNPLGLYDMYGNVFEFCSGLVPGDNGKSVAHSRGGSWWCSRNSCCFFNSVDIGKVNPRASFSNQGFRVAKTVAK